VVRISGGTPTTPAGYRWREKVVYINAEYVLDIARKYGKDVAYCEMLSLAAHEFQHIVDIHINGIHDIRELEKNALYAELREFSECLSRKGIKSLDTGR
jgi:hypothetical protein